MCQPPNKNWASYQLRKKVKQFLGSNEESLKMEMAGFDFRDLIANILLVLDDVEHY